MSLSDLPAPLQALENQAKECFKTIQNSFQKVEKASDANRKLRTLDDITPKLRDCRRAIQDFDRVLKETEDHYPPEVARMLHDKKKGLVKELNAFVTMKKTVSAALAQGQTVKITSDGKATEVASASDSIAAMSNQEIVAKGHEIMDDTDKAVMRSRQVVESTINIGAQTATTLRGQTEQMERIVDNLETLDFSLKQATKLIRRYGRQVATDKCILILMALLVLSIVAVIILKITKHNSSTGAIPSVGSTS